MKQAAENAYKKSQARVEQLVDGLQKSLADHAQKHEQDPQNWGHVEDMECVKELLVRATAVLDRNQAQRLDFARDYIY